MVECLLHAQWGAGSPSAHPCSPCTGEGEGPRESQALAELEHRTEAKGQCFPGAILHRWPPLPDFRAGFLSTHGQGIQEEAKVDEGQGLRLLLPLAICFSRRAVQAAPGLGPVSCS